jgi:DNA-binding IclR family transcriptional regulator
VSARAAATQLGLPRSSAYRFLQTLERRGFAARTVKDGFSLGPAFLELASGTQPRPDLREIALPHMRRLSAESGESVFLVMEQAGHAVVVEKVSPAAPVRLQLDVGTRLPLHAGAVSKVLLAFGAPRGRPAELPRVARRTVTDPRRLERELAAIRVQGYSVTVEEAIPGSWGVGVPILPPGTSLAMASLSVGGPIHRFDRERVPGYVAALQRAARAIARQLQPATPDGRTRRHGAAERRFGTATEAAREACRIDRDGRQAASERSWTLTHRPNRRRQATGGRK